MMMMYTRLCKVYVLEELAMMMVVIVKAVVVVINRFESGTGPSCGNGGSGGYGGSGSNGGRDVEDGDGGRGRTLCLATIICIPSTHQSTPPVHS